MSSRLIVKGLPKKTTAEQLKEHFSKCGQITDVRLVHTRDGVFRRFAFVGYATEHQATEAIAYYNNTFIGSSRIEVEAAKPYGDKDIPRPWSKYSKGSSAYREKDKQKNPEVVEGGEKEKKKEDVLDEKECQQRLNQDRHKSKLMSMLSEYYQLESDPQFAEFMAAHKSKSSRQVWTNDESTGPRKEKRTSVKPFIVSVQARRPGGEGILLTRTHLKFDNDDDGSKEEEKEEESEVEEVEDKAVGEQESDGAADVSDMEYLRSKMVVQSTTVGEYVSEEEEEEEEEKEKDEEESEERNDMTHSSTFTLKMRGLPFHATEEDIRTFFYPLQLSSVRMPLDNRGRPSGSAFVDFNSFSDMKEALRRNKDCMGHRYIELFTDKGPYTPVVKETKEKELRPWEEKKEGDEEEEPIADSGRLFVRNLSYSITEEDLTVLFSKYGPLTELNMLTDKGSGQPIGLAFVTFMFPEHAVKAVEELDGQIYQGRLLHILPAKPRRVKEEREGEVGRAAGSSYKKQKAKQQQKTVSHSGHRWNALFLGANAVVDAMADQYSTAKSVILDTDTDQSIAVRMALGETQLVAETKEFLEENGVKLDVFDQQRPKRSKSIILVKNLPFGTPSSELTKLFSKYGTINRLVLPPYGVSALVEYSSASSASAAFSNLANAEFQHLPLYLEWAPVGAFGKKSRTKSETEETEQGRTEETKDTDDVISASSDQSTIFVKNLNFSTTTDGLKAVFSSLPGLKQCSVATKMNMKDPSKPLSMGYGFVEFSSHKQAMTAIKTLQGHTVDDHKLELKLSHHPSAPETHTKKELKNTVQKSPKILVRNVPFEATRKEVWQLFSTFGELKLVRLPQKYGRQKGEHRGFGFVEFALKEDAKRAMEALGRSTHLYGRRLVLEWADQDESLDEVRKRTARYFHGSAPPVKKRQRVTELLTSLTSRRNEEDEEED